MKQPHLAVILPLIIACALFMENMDATVISTSLPVLAHDLGQNPITLKLALTSYVVGLGVFIPICGWVADRYGSCSVFRTAICVFMLGSLLCAVSSSVPAFVAARFLQGVGGAMMVPVGRIIIFRAVPKSELVKAITYLTTPALLGPVIGPPLGGFITTYFHWRWIFLVNIPISLLGLYLAGRFIPNYRGESTEPLDTVGFVLSALGSSLSMLGLALLGSQLAPLWLSMCACVAGAMLMLAYFRYAGSAEKPLLDLRLLKIPTFRVSVLGGSFFRIGLGAVPFLLPLSLQEGLGMNAFHSGLITCASAVGAMFMKSLCPYILRQYGFRKALMVNAFFAGVALAAYGLFSVQTPIWVLLLIVCIGGFFPALQFTALNTVVYADIASEDAGRATSLASVVQQLSLGMGVIVAGMALQLSHYLQGHAQFTASDFWPAFLVLGLFSMASIPVTRQLPHNAGNELAKSASA